MKALNCNHFITNKIVTLIRFFENKTSTNIYTQDLFTSSTFLNLCTNHSLIQYFQWLFTILPSIQFRFTCEVIIITIKQIKSQNKLAVHLFEIHNLQK